MFFITFANPDIEFVQELAHRLEEVGLSCWYDAERVRGNSPIWSAEIQKRLLSADAVLLVLSPDCTASQYAVFEWASAYRAGVPIVPIFCRRSLLHPALAEFPVYDFTLPSQRDWGRLLEDLLARFGGGVQRRYATQEMPALGSKVDPTAVGALKKLRDPAELTREAGLYELAALLPKQPELITTFALVMAHDESQVVREAAGRCLREAGLSRLFIEALYELQQPDPKRRLRGVTSLLQVEDPRVTVPLLAALHDSDLEVQGAAIKALGVLRDPNSLAELVELLDSDDAEMAKVAAAAVLGFGDKAIQPLTDRLHRASHKERLVETLAATGSRAAVYPLIHQLRDDMSPYSLFVARTLAQMGAVATEAMIYVMRNNEDNQLRRAVVRALGRSQNPAMIKVLVEALANTDSATRTVISSALIANYGRQALPYLKTALQHDDWAVRGSAAAIIREMGLDPRDYGYVEQTDYDS